MGQRKTASGYVMPTEWKTTRLFLLHNSSVTGFMFTCFCMCGEFMLDNCLLTTSVSNARRFQLVTLLTTVNCTPFLLWPVPLVLQDYIDAHPETIILDPLPAIRTLLDRCKSYQLVHRIEDCMRGTVIQLGLHHIEKNSHCNIFFSLQYILWRVEIQECSSDVWIDKKIK